MVKVLHDSSHDVLDESAKEYVRAVVKEALNDDPQLDSNLFARLIEGELEEFNLVDPHDGYAAISEIKSIVQASRIVM